MTTPGCQQHWFSAVPWDMPSPTAPHTSPPPYSHPFTPRFFILLSTRLCRAPVPPALPPPTSLTGPAACGVRLLTTEVLLLYSFSVFHRVLLRCECARCAGRRGRGGCAGRGGRRGPGGVPEQLLEVWCSACTYENMQPRYLNCEVCETVRNT
jgi:hypothetical protein